MAMARLPNARMWATASSAPFGAATVVQRHVHAHLRQHQGDAPSDAGAGAGDKHLFPAQITQIQWHIFTAFRILAFFS